jgi:hypothetical protein
MLRRSLIYIVTISFLPLASFAESQTENKEAALDRWILKTQSFLEKRSRANIDGQFAFGSEDQIEEYLDMYLAGDDEIVIPDFDDQGFGDDDAFNPFPDPTDDPLDFDLPNLPFPYSSRRSGASEILALEVLYQTFMFYGVIHIVEKQRHTVKFKVIRSKSGYFKNLTKLDVAYAIREFSRFFLAHLCNKSTMANFYDAFAQVPPEEIGLRFKYDMAWALLGNTLPKEPNAIYAMGTRWKALNQILRSTDSIKGNSTEQKELKSWASSVTDVVNILSRLNKLMCYVDIRPKPKDELKKRIVVKKILRMEARLRDRYSKFKELLDSVENEAKKAQLSTLGVPIGRNQKD